MTEQGQQSKLIGKNDKASSDVYDSAPTKQSLDSEILKRRKVGRWMAIAAVVLLALFTLCFFLKAICYGSRFVWLQDTIMLSSGMLSSGMPSSNVSIEKALSALPFLAVSMLPAIFFSILGIVTMITSIRFITSFMNPHDSDSSVSLIESIIDRITQAVTVIVRNFKGTPE